MQARIAALVLANITAFPAAHGHWVAAAGKPHAPHVTVQGHVTRTSIHGGQVQRLTAVVRSNADVRAALVDFEVYDSLNHKVFQAIQHHDLVTAVPVVVTQPFTVSHRALGGPYHLSVGVFGPRWTPLYVWGPASWFYVIGPLPMIVSATGSVRPVLAHPGETVTLTARISASHGSLSHVLVDIDLVKASGLKLCQRVTTGVRVPKDGSMQVRAHCVIPAGQASGDYIMKVGVFGPKWSSLYTWNDNATILTIVASPS